MSDEGTELTGAQVTALHVGNFKCFGPILNPVGCMTPSSAAQGAARIPLGPVTFVYGPNSSGKSTLIQALLLLAQSLRRQPGSRALRSLPDLTLSGVLTDLGSFEAIAHGHQTGQDVALGVEYEVDYHDSDEDGSDSHRTEPGGCVVTFRKNQVHAVAFLQPWLDPPSWLRFKAQGEGVRYLTPDEHSTAAYLALVTGVHDRPPPAGLTPFLLAEGWFPCELAGWRTASGSVTDRLGHYPDERPLEPGEAEWLGRRDHRLIAEEFAAVGNQWLRELEAVLQRVRHVSGLRRPPSRWAEAVGASPAIGDDPEIDGSGFTPGSLVDSFPLRDDALPSVSERLMRMGVPYELELVRYQTPQALPALGAAEYRTLLLRHRETGLLTSTADVGLGVSQLLPVVGAAMLSQGSVITIEQPETHVHPRLQAEISDVLLDSSADNSNQLIVETHSDNLVLRVGKRIRENGSRPVPGDIHVLYVSQLTDGSSVVHRIELNEYGDFNDPWPEGFADIRLNELLADD